MSQRERDTLYEAIELYPVVGVGHVVHRFDDCQRCMTVTLHKYECLVVQPRVWGYTCLACNTRKR